MSLELDPTLEDVLNAIKTLRDGIRADMKAMESRIKSEVRADIKSAENRLSNDISGAYDLHERRIFKLEKLAAAG